MRGSRIHEEVTERLTYSGHLDPRGKDARADWTRTRVLKYTGGVSRTDADDAFIRRAVEVALPNALRMSLLQATGDPVLADMALVSARTASGGVAAPTLSDEDLEYVRARAMEFLSGDRRPIAPLDVTDVALRPLLDVAHGAPVTDTGFRAWRHVLAFEEYPLFRRWDGPPPRIPDDFHVVVIGAGFSGIAMGVQLGLLGIPYTVLERRSEVGGTWSINTYPDARVDTGSVGSYEYVFAGPYRWSEYFPRQAEVRRYIEHVAREHEVFGHIRFNSRVVRAEFDSPTSSWVVDFEDDSGEIQTLRANVVVSGSGLFSVAKRLDVEGVESFAGEILHPTQWTADRSVAGKSVAVIGNGSTGVQLLHRVACEADNVYVFQRTAQWITPREGYGAPMPEELHWLFDNMPYYWNWHRYVVQMPLVKMYDMIVPDRNWQAEGGHVNELNDGLRAGLTAYIRSQLAGKPELVDHLIPSYPPMVRRLVVDNRWYESLLRDNVELITEGIQRIDEGGIHLVSGGYRRVDVIVAAIGYEVTKYVWPAEYRGPGGVKLEDAWEAEGPRAYLGMMVPGFPNFFLLYGPNSQPNSGQMGIPSWMEAWAGYVGELIKLMLVRGHREVEVDGEAFRRYYAEFEAAAADLLFLQDEASKSRNYYVDATGRLSVGVPWRGEDYCLRVLEADRDDIVTR